MNPIPTTKLRLVVSSNHRRTIKRQHIKLPTIAFISIVKATMKRNLRSEVKSGWNIEEIKLYLSKAKSLCWWWNVCFQTFGALCHLQCLNRVAIESEQSIKIIFCIRTCSPTEYAWKQIFNLNVNLSSSQPVFYKKCLE